MATWDGKAPIGRRSVILGGAALVAGCATGGVGSGSGGAGGQFVRREGTRFTIGGATYRFAGANMWYAAYLGADAPYGNRDRLRRELDRLRDLGVTNIRVLASSEQSPLRGAISPSFRDSGTTYSEKPSHIGTAKKNIIVVPCIVKISL